MECESRSERLMVFAAAVAGAICGYMGVPSACIDAKRRQQNLSAKVQRQTFLSLKLKYVI
jgi:hypothetical protein